MPACSSPSAPRRAERAPAFRGPPHRRGLLPRPRHHVELLPGNLHGEDRRRGIAEREAAALGGNPIAVGNPHSRGRAVPGKDHVVLEIDGAEVGELTVAGVEHARVELWQYHRQSLCQSRPQDVVGFLYFFCYNGNIIGKVCVSQDHRMLWAFSVSSVIMAISSAKSVSVKITGCCGLSLFLLL